jgi:hypothetical protein
LKGPTASLAAALKLFGASWCPRSLPTFLSQQQAPLRAYLQQRTSQTSSTFLPFSEAVPVQTFRRWYRPAGANIFVFLEGKTEKSDH